LISLIVTRLSSDGDLETKGISPSFSFALAARVQGMVNEVGARCVFRVATIPRLTNPGRVERTNFSRCRNGLLAYVGKTGSVDTNSFYYSKA